jgi:hypothetical protein
VILRDYKLIGGRRLYQRRLEVAKGGTSRLPRAGCLSIRSRKVVSRCPEIGVKSKIHRAIGFATTYGSGVVFVCLTKTYRPWQSK